MKGSSGVAALGVDKGGCAGQWSPSLSSRHILANRPGGYCPTLLM